TRSYGDWSSDVCSSDLPNPAQLLELEVDLRIYELLLEAWGELEWDESLIGRYLRLAYAAGYLDSLLEPCRGELCRKHGFPIPKRSEERRVGNESRVCCR